MSLLSRKPCDFHGVVVCGCNRQLTRCKCKGVVPVSRIECIHTGTPRELFEELVRNAASFRAEDPTRMAWAMRRIAKAEHRKVDAVFGELLSEVEVRTGQKRLPGTALDFRSN